MTEGYDAIARVYDKLNEEIDYSAWADFIEKIFDKYLAQKPNLVLDLACGTGSMTMQLATRGYDMIGVDGSCQMLSVANERKYDMGEAGNGILYLLQDMKAFELYGTVGAVVCCLDSINYLLTREDIEKCFSCVHNYLDPDGVFIFDVNTPYKFKNIYGDNAYILEDTIDGGDIYCGWQNDFSEITGLCDFHLTLFSEDENGKFFREIEHQTEKMYTMNELRTSLEATGFELIGFYTDYAFTEAEIDDEAERWYIAARAKK